MLHTLSHILSINPCNLISVSVGHITRISTWGISAKWSWEQRLQHKAALFLKYQACSWLSLCMHSSYLGNFHLCEIPFLMMRRLLQLVHLRLRRLLQLVHLRWLLQPVHLKWLLQQVHLSWSIQLMVLIQPM